jgi:PST family polysaccharide transporter
MSLRAQAARGLKWQAIEIGGRQVLSLVVFTIIARVLEPSAFGLVGLVGVYLAFVGMFVDQGIGTAIVQRKELEPGHLDVAFWFNISCAAALCGGTMLLAGPISLFFREPKLQPLLQWASLSLVINAAAAVHHTLYLRNLDFRPPAVRALVGNVVGGAIGIVMAMTGCGVWSLVGQQLAGSLAGAVFLWTASTWRPTLACSVERLRELMAVSLSVFSVDFLWFFSSRLDQVVIGRFLGAGALGQYVVGGKLTEFAKTAIHRPVGAVSMPALARLQDDRARMCQAIYHGMEFNAVISFAIFVGLAAVARDVIPFAFGPKWVAAATICELLSLYSLLNALQVFFHPALLASGGPGGYVFLNVLHAGGVGIVCVFGLRWGVSALILGLIANGLVVAIPALIFLRRRIGLNVSRYCQPCLIPAVSSLVMVGVILLLRSALAASLPEWLRIAAQFAGGAIAYTTTIALLAPQVLKRLVGMMKNACAPSRSAGPVPLQAETS